jgi:hypothetical protein
MLVCLLVLLAVLLRPLLPPAAVLDSTGLLLWALLLLISCLMQILHLSHPLLHAFCLVDKLLLLALVLQHLLEVLLLC